MAGARRRDPGPISGSARCSTARSTPIWTRSGRPSARGRDQRRRARRQAVAQLHQPRLPQFDLCAPLAGSRHLRRGHLRAGARARVGPGRPRRRTCAALATVPGGHVIVSTPFLVRVHELADYGMPDLWRFTPRGLRVLLEHAGLEVDWPSTPGATASAWSPTSTAGRPTAAGSRCATRPTCRSRCGRSPATRLRQAPARTPAPRRPGARSPPSPGFARTGRRSASAVKKALEAAVIGALVDPADRAHGRRATGAGHSELGHQRQHVLGQRLGPQPAGDGQPAVIGHPHAADRRGRSAGSARRRSAAAAAGTRDARRAGPVLGGAQHPGGQPPDVHGQQLAAHLGLAGEERQVLVIGVRRVGEA